MRVNLFCFSLFYICELIGLTYSYNYRFMDMWIDPHKLKKAKKIVIILILNLSILSK